MANHQTSGLNATELQQLFNAWRDANETALLGGTPRVRQLAARVEAEIQRLCETADESIDDAPMRDEQLIRVVLVCALASLEAYWYRTQGLTVENMLATLQQLPHNNDWVGEIVLETRAYYETHDLTGDQVI